MIALILIWDLQHLNANPLGFGGTFLPLEFHIDLAEWLLAAFLVLFGNLGTIALDVRSDDIMVVKTHNSSLCQFAGLLRFRTAT